jgi:hypothetical protein
MDNIDPEEIKIKLEDLRIEHKDLDLIIDNILNDTYVDQLLIKRLKKRKLQLKDTIAKLESLLIPDLNA